MVEWRERKALECPDDHRNQEAVVLSRRLIADLSEFKSPTIRLFEDIEEDVCRNPDVGAEAGRIWSEYRSSLGFRKFPDDGEEYLRTLIDLVEDLTRDTPSNLRTM